MDADEKDNIPGTVTLLAADHARDMLNSAAVMLAVAEGAARTDGAHRLARELHVFAKAAEVEADGVNAALVRSWS